jgi:hypothetical protein
MTDHVSELLSSYVDDGVTTEEAERIGRHLEACAACRADLSALQGVVGLLRSVPPVAAPADLRVAIRSRVEQAGPPSSRRGLGHLPKLRWSRLAASWRPMVAAAAVVVIGVYAANLLGPEFAHRAGVRREGSPTSTVSTFETAKEATGKTGAGPQSAPGPANRGAVAVPPGTPVPGPSPDAVFRSVIRTARLTVDVDRYDAGARTLLDIAEGAGGFIADSSYSEEEGRPQGEFTLRVPAGRFGAAVKDAEAMGTVRQRQISAQDVTEEYVDLQARQRNLERHEQQLLTFMDRANKVPDLLAIEQELSRVRGQIEQITGRLRYLSHNVEMATIIVTLSEHPKKTHAGLWDFGATIEKMRGAFLVTVRQIFAAAERVLVLASSLVPVGALAGIAWAVFRRTRPPRAGAGS